MAATYYPEIFDAHTMGHARAIILTGEGSTTAERWQVETPWLGDQISSLIEITPDTLLVDYGCGIGRVAKELIARFGSFAEVLGAPRFYPEEARKELPTGVATGMAGTETGGQLLFIEATLLPGSSGLQLTGQLGEVMQESIQAAMTVVRSRATLIAAWKIGRAHV